MTREEWLKHAVEELDSQLFNGDLDLLNHGYRITWGKCPGKKLTECVQPFDGEDVKLDDFFPTTISVSYTAKDPVEMLAALAYECIHAFFNIKGTNKKFKKLADKYYFDAPFTSAHMTPVLHDILRDVYTKLQKEYGAWEDIAKPVVFHKKESNQKKNTLTIFCPNCGLEFKVNKKKFEKAGSKLPVCGCGSHMGIDCEEEDSTDSSSNEQ